MKAIKTLAFVILLSLVGCGNSRRDFSYKVAENNEKNEKALTISIPKILDSADLVDLTKNIREEEGDAFGKQSVFYIIEGQRKGTMAWARVDFEPKISIGYINRTKQLDDSLFNLIKNIKGNVLSVWNGGNEKYNIALLDSGKQNIVKHIYAEGTYTVDTLLASKLENGLVKLRSQNQDFHGEFLVVNSNGDLEFYNKQSVLYNVLKKIR